MSEKLISVGVVLGKIEKEIREIPFIADPYAAIRTDYDIGYNNALAMAKAIVMNAPAVDAVEVVRHGYWDDSGKYTYPDGSIAIQCSECGCDLEEHEYKEYWWHYCPVCGAKMDGKETGDR